MPEVTRIIALHQVLSEEPEVIARFDIKHSSLGDITEGQLKRCWALLFNKKWPELFDQLDQLGIKRIAI